MVTVIERTRETWLCDLGNSRAKLARLEAGEPADFVAYRWDQDGLAARIQRATAGWPRPERIFVASVTSAAHAGVFRSQLPDGPDIAIEWLTSPRYACGVSNSYRTPGRLGIDRFLSMIAVHAHVAGAAIVIGCGTAVTLDAVASNGEHVAGLISLSPAHMLRTLRSDIAEMEPCRSEPGCDETEGADPLGKDCWTTTSAQVRWFARRQQEVIGTAPVWLHGGWAESLAAWLRHDGFHAEVMTHAVLHGLALWAQQPTEQSVVGASRRDD